jgi:hypothetical protein
MKKTKIIIIGLLLILTTAFTVVSAETETTYYCYTNGEWGTCTPSEAILAQEAMTKETPRSLSRDEIKTLLSSHEPFRDYYTTDDDMTVTPTLALVPTQRPIPVPTGFWESIIKNRLPSRWLSRFS